MNHFACMPAMVGEPQPPHVLPDVSLACDGVPCHAAFYRTAGTLGRIYKRVRGALPRPVRDQFAVLLLEIKPYMVPPAHAGPGDVHTGRPEVSGIAARLATIAQRRDARSSPEPPRRTLRLEELLPAPCTPLQRGQPQAAACTPPRTLRAGVPPLQACRAAATEAPSEDDHCGAPPPGPSLPSGMPPRDTAAAASRSGECFFLKIAPSCCPADSSEENDPDSYELCGHVLEFLDAVDIGGCLGTHRGFSQLADFARFIVEDGSALGT